MMKSVMLGLTIFFCTSLQAQEVLILGVAQDAGHPQADCHKNCCASVHDGTANPHLVSSLAISDGLSFWIIDATPDFPEQLRIAQGAFEGQSFSGVILTHAHIGHYTGLMYLGREAMGAKSVPVFVMPRMKSYLENNGPWSQLVELKNIQLIQMIDNERVKLGEYLTLTPILVPHRDEFSETVGFSVASNEKNLLFIPDIDKWDRWHLSLDQIIGEYDHLLLDGTFYDGRELPGRNMEEIPHPFVVETNELLKALSLEEKEKVQFIHLNHTNPLLNQDSKEYQEVMLSGYRVARRGDLITLY